MPHVAFVECNTAGAHAVATAKGLGYEVTVVTRDPDGRGVPHGADHVLTADTADPAALVAALAGHDVDGIACLDARHGPAAAAAARALGLPGPDPDAVARTRDRAATRQALAAAGLANPRFAAVVGERAALTAAADETGYPCLVGTADRDAGDPRLAAGPGDLLAHLRSATGRGDLVVEEYLRGPLYGVETVTDAGRTEVVGITEHGAASPATGLLPWQRRYLERAAVAALRAVGLDHGVGHTVVRLTGRGPRVVAVDAGVVAPAAGIDLTAAALRLAVGRPADAVPVLAADRFRHAPAAASDQEASAA
jgi:biotin carboxylase